MFDGPLSLKFDLFFPSVPMAIICTHGRLINRKHQTANSKQSTANRIEHDGMALMTNSTAVVSAGGRGKRKRPPTPAGVPDVPFHVLRIWVFVWVFVLRDAIISVEKAQRTIEHPPNVKRHIEPIVNRNR